MNKLGGIMASRRGRRKEPEAQPTSRISKALEEAVEEVDSFQSLLKSFQKSLLKSKSEDHPKLIEKIGKGFQKSISRFNELHAKVIEERIKIKREQLGSEEVEEEVELRVEENGSSHYHKKGRNVKKEKDSFSLTNEDETFEERSDSKEKQNRAKDPILLKKTEKNPVKGQLNISSEHSDHSDGSEDGFDLGLGLGKDTLNSSLEESYSSKKNNAPGPKSKKPRSVQKSSGVNSSAEGSGRIVSGSHIPDDSLLFSDEDEEKSEEPVKVKPGPKSSKGMTVKVEKRVEHHSDEESEEEPKEEEPTKRSRKDMNSPGPKRVKEVRNRRENEEDEEEPEKEEKKKENGVNKLVIKLNTKNGNSVSEKEERVEKTPSPQKRRRGRPKKNKVNEEEEEKEEEKVPKIKIKNMKNLLVNFSDAETEVSEDEEENPIPSHFPPDETEEIQESEEGEEIDEDDLEKNKVVQKVPDLKERAKLAKCSVKIDRLVLTPKKMEKLRKKKELDDEEENGGKENAHDTSVVVIESTDDQEPPSPVKRSKRTRKIRSQSGDSDSDVVAKQKKKKIKLKNDNSSDYEEEEEEEENSPEFNSDSSGVELIKVKRKFKRVKKMSNTSSEDDGRRVPRKRNDSESEFTDSDSGKEKKKKRKRRKKKGDSGDDDDDDDNESTRKGKGRKDLRKMVDKGRDTKEVEKEEEDRKKRISEKQKEFNGLFQNPESDVIDRLVLDFDPKTKEPLVSVDEKLVAKLKPHQAKGIKFMWDTCFESLEITKKNPEKGGGGILAHCMGLGKTLQTIAFLHTIMTKQELGIKLALVICPLNTVGNWARELKEWLEDLDEDLPIHRLWEAQGPKGRADALKGWEKRGGVGILHYEAFRGLALLEGRKSKKKEKETFTRILLDPGPHIVVCDEGHLLKNENSKVSKAVNKIKTLRRIVLTGTPLQNNLIEYHTMMSFVKPKLLGTTKEFRSRFVNPITNGQHKDSTDRDVRIMKRRAHVLHKLLDGCVQRMDFTVLTPYLPPKFEFVLFINLGEVQVKLYEYYLKEIAKVESLEEIAERMKKKGSFFRDYQTLQKVLTHPLLLSFQKEAEETADSDDSINDFICDDESDEAEETPVELSGSDDEVKEIVVKKKHRTRGNRDKSPTPPQEIKNYGGKWWSSFFDTEESIQKIELSGKLVVLMEILKICESIGDKVLVFSQYLTSLDLIETFLNDIEEKFVAGEKEVSDEETIYFSRWRKNIEYFRIDGSVKTNDRQKKLEHFNDEDARKAKLFLISTKAGGMGVNLVGANRVILFDVSWNPSQDLQSLFRAYRFGQKKPVYVYRLLAQGTMEEKIYNRQVVKLSLSCRVVDEQQIERHFKFDDIAQMYKYNPEEKNTTTMALPADHLLADLITNQKQWIDNYIEHDTLLANKEEEELTEEERKAAWEDYESEKNRPMTFANAHIQQATDYELANIRQTLLGIHLQRGINMDFNLLNVYAQHAKRDIATLKTLNSASMNPRIIPEIRESYTLQIRQIQERLNTLFSKGYNNDYFPQTPAPNPNLQSNPFMNLFNTNLMSLMNQRMRVPEATATQGSSSGVIPTPSTSRTPAILRK